MALDVAPAEAAEGETLWPEGTPVGQKHALAQMWEGVSSESHAESRFFQTPHDTAGREFGPQKA